MFAWQGWKLDLPPGWNPLKLEGDYARGHVLIADMHHPRVGLHWTTPGKKFDTTAWARKALIDEVGRLAADESRSCASALWAGAMLYLEPSPPGRDVWVAHSATSGRTIEMVCHVDRMSDRRIDDLVRSLQDCSPKSDQPWAVFDLSCRTPANWRLKEKQLNAGDLSLSFARGQQRATVRQIAIAELALKRLTLEKWLVEQQRRHQQPYRCAGETSPVSISTADGRKLEGVRGQMTRRRRFFWARHLSPQIVSVALHDAARDRLVLADLSEPSMLEPMVRSIGWADERKN